MCLNAEGYSCTLSLSPDRRMTTQELRDAFLVDLFEDNRLNIGAAVTVIVDGIGYTMDTLDGLYIGRGMKQETFTYGCR